MGKEDIAAGQVKQARGNWAIARLTRRQDQFGRQTANVGQGMDLRRQTAARVAHTAIRVAFFEFAAC